MKNRFSISNYLSLIKFSHTIFALPFAFIGYFLALNKTNKTFDYYLFILIIFCMIFARTSAMAFNRFIDKKIDKKNPRTTSREIPSGILSAKNVLIFTIINSLLFIGTTYFINSLCFFLSPVALIVILGYSYTKKFTSLCHFVLGIGLSLAPIGSYISVTGEFHIFPILFSIIVLLWVSGFDIIYSLQDYKFDKNEKLKSIPVFLGPKNALLLSRLLHFIVAIIVFYISIFYFDFSVLSIIGSSIFISMLFIQHLLVKHDDLSKVNFAFFTTNGFASIIYSSFLIIDLLFFR